MNKVSIIVPNFNHARYLPQCLESVLSQTYQALEIIIADDCSSDDSPKIISYYAARHINIKAIFNTQRLQVSWNRHQAIKQSVGEYITTLDSDDFYYDKLKLEREMEILRANKKKFGKDVCAFSNVVVFDEDNNSQGLQWSEEDILEGDIFKELFARRCMIPRDFIFSRSLYERAGGYDPAFNLYEDWDFKIRLSRIAEFYYSGIPGVVYRRKGSGLSYVPVRFHIDALRAIWEKNSGLIRMEEKEYITSNLSRHLDFIEKNQV